MELPLSGRRRRFSLCLTAIAGIAGGHVSAAAGDWSITASLAETISATDNVEFDAEDRIPAIGSNSSIGLDIFARSHLYDFNLSGDWGYQVYFGENQDVPDPQYVPSLFASYERRARDLTFKLGASYVFTPGEDQRGITILPGQDSDVPGGDPGDDIITIDTSDTNADQQTVSANSTTVYKVNTTNNLTWTLDGYRIDFTGDNADEATPSTNAGTSLVWNNNRTRRVDLNLTGSADWYSYENDEDQVQFVYTLTGGFTNRVTPRLTITGSLGIQLLDSYQDEPTGEPPTIEERRTNTTDLGGTGSLSFSYRLKTGGISGGISYGLTPDSDGELANALTATAGYNRTINDRSSFNIGAAFRLADSEVDGVLSDTSFSVAPSYNYAISRHWNMGLGYSFNYQDTTEGVVTENVVNLTISRSYTILP